jgi:hypothetical protein
MIGSFVTITVPYAILAVILEKLSSKTMISFADLDKFTSDAD